MINLTWLAEVVFYTSYFIAWVTKQLPQGLLWVTVSAIAALVAAVALVFFNGAHITPQHVSRN